MKSNFNDIVKKRNDLFAEQDRIFFKTVNQINTRNRALLTQNFGTTLMKNCAVDFSSQIVNNYFPAGDTYITVDQMFNRIVNFRYDNDPDPLASNEAFRKDVYNMSNEQNTKDIVKDLDNTKSKLFTEPRSEDSTISKSTRKYREKNTVEDNKTGNRGLEDSLTGEIKYEDMDIDHVQSINAASSDKHMTEKGIEELKDFYNSDNNLQAIDKTANRSKGDVRVYDTDGKDITHRATAEQLADATIERWTKEGNPERIETLKKEGYLDENGKVKPEVRKKLIENNKESMNKESHIVLKNTNYTSVGKDALKQTKKLFGKIIAGQIIYYTLPPMIYETQRIIGRKNVGYNSFLSELSAAGKRVIDYVISKLKTIFSSMLHNSFKTLVRNFFDIIVNMVKSTVKRMMKLVKNIAMAFVTSAKTIMDKNKSAAEKANAVTTTLAVSISAVALEVLFEYLEKQFGLPNWLMEPLQIIVTILVSNVIMLVLEKMDLFNVKHGLLIANMKKIFEEEKQMYIDQSNLLRGKTEEEITVVMENLEQEIKNIQTNINNLDVNNDDLELEINRINEIFSMNIDLKKEWNDFNTKVEQEILEVS